MVLSRGPPVSVSHARAVLREYVGNSPIVMDNLHRAAAGVAGEEGEEGEEGENSHSQWLSLHHTYLQAVAAGIPGYWILYLVLASTRYSSYLEIKLKVRPIET